MSAPPTTPYVRFVVRAAARTGSTMLVRALNAHPNVRCFGEVFNSEVDFVPFEVDGYDNFSARDRALRDHDPQRFLRERIFGEQPPEVRAVGFKLLYAQNWSYPDLLPHLAADRALRVVHLRRRNLLRALVSWKIAEATGVWAVPAGAALARANVVRALRHPLRASAALARRLRRPTARADATGPPVRLSPDECARMFRFLRALEARSDEMFAGHPLLAVYYEDLVAQPERFDEVQSFLGVEPRPFAPPTQRQNPASLRELLANYDELRAAFAGTEHEAFFDE